MADNIVQTSRQDLPEWAQPLGLGQEQLLLQYLFPDGKWVSDPNGPFKNKTKFDFGSTMPSAERLGMPMLQNTKFNPLETMGQWGAVGQSQKNIGINDQSMQWIQDALGRGVAGVDDAPQDFARTDQTYNLAGPIAGATRSSLLDLINGNVAQGANQKYLDAMYGKTANAADQSAYNALAGQGQANDANRFDYAGQNAGAANQQALNTINGGYLGPNSNPYLRANVDAASKAVADNYKYATAPGTDAQFARAGSFGGSAHQQTKNMQQFDLGRNLSDLANTMYGSNYNTERGNQLGAIQNQQSLGMTALQSALSRAQTTQENALNRGSGLAQDAMGGQRQLTDNSATRQQQGSEAELNRAVQLQSLLPQLMQSQYLPYDVQRTIGAEGRAMTDQNNQINYQNQNSLFQLPFNLLNIMGANLGSATGGQGVTTQTSTNPNNVGTGAQVAGGLGLGVSALSNLGSFLMGGNQQQQRPAAGTG